jgi:hypothetical protein
MRLRVDEAIPLFGGSYVLEVTWINHTLSGRPVIDTDVVTVNVEGEV